MTSSKFEVLLLRSGRRMFMHSLKGDSCIKLIRNSTRNNQQQTKAWHWNSLPHLTQKKKVLGTSVNMGKTITIKISLHESNMPAFQTLWWQTHINEDLFWGNRYEKNRTGWATWEHPKPCCPSGHLFLKCHFTGTNRQSFEILKQNSSKQHAHTVYTCCQWEHHRE